MIQYNKLVQSIIVYFNFDRFFKVAYAFTRNLFGRFDPVFSAL